MEEMVVLVDEDNNEIGTVGRDAVHTQNTPLHRGFSLFLFNSKDELLLTKRSARKKTFPSVWTNTVCGHPELGESAPDAARRRLKDELGIEIKSGGARSRFAREVAPYRYRFADANGIVENEICPVLIAHADADPKPDKNEVDDWKWIGWEEFLEDLKKNPENYSPWSREETRLIHPGH